MSKATIVLFRNDLRLEDNPALCAAIARGAPVIPVFIWSPEEDGPWSPGGASRWWLHHSLSALRKELESIGLKLIILRHESSLTAIEKLIERCGADCVYWNRRYEPLLIDIDKNNKISLKNQELEVKSFPGNLIFEPWTIATAGGTAYKVYTPYWRACREAAEESVKPPLKKPERAPGFASDLSGLSLEELDLLPDPKIDWAKGMRAFWKPGEAGARTRLKTFLTKGISEYQTERDRPDHDGVSYLSPHLHFGEISPRFVWQEVQDAVRHSTSEKKKKNAEVYLKEVVWREFAHHVLYHFPGTVEEPLRESFRDFPWSAKDRELFRSWKKGNTGYPIVDAGMRQLWTTGWMHNRVRMIVASFLTKDLLISWRDGADWFWDTLVDADLASNTFGWQWTAGCGADAAPFFRIFNPVLQGKRFDPRGDYVRTYVPELKNAPDKWIHEPWNANPEDLAACGIELGKTYPYPIVDHGQARKKALAIFSEIKQS